MYESICSCPLQCPYLAQLQHLPVFNDVSHQLHVKVKILLLVDYTQVVQTQMNHILPERG